MAEGGFYSSVLGFINTCSALFSIFKCPLIGRAHTKKINTATKTQSFLVNIVINVNWDEALWLYNDIMFFILVWPQNNYIVAHLTFSYLLCDSYLFKSNLKAILYKQSSMPSPHREKTKLTSKLNLHSNKKILQLAA